jgi:hypothetical protein
MACLLVVTGLLWVAETQAQAPAADKFLDSIFPTDVQQKSELCLGLGNATFDCRDLTAEFRPSAGIALGDLDGDERLDAVLANTGRENQACLGDSTGSFTCLDVSTDAFPSVGVALGLIDDDDILDAVFANGAGSRRNDRVCFGVGDGSFTGCKDVSSSAYISAGVALADMNKDGKLDAVFANTSLQNNRICLGDGRGGFTCTNVSSDAISSAAVAIGDMDNDGKLDAVFANGPNRTNRVCFGDGNGGFDGCQNVSSDARSSTSVALGFVNGDANVDAVFANFNQVDRICLGNGNGGFTCGDVNPGAFPSRGVALGDVDGSGTLDAVFANYQQKNRVCLGFGQGSFICGDVSGSSFRSQAVALGHVNPPPNRAPELAPIGDQTVLEGATLVVALSATDPDGDALGFSATDLPDFGTLTDDGDGTGSIRFEPETGDAGSYDITVTVTDDGIPAKTDSETFTLTVLDAGVIVPIIVPLVVD